ncbi:MAG: SDR family NAD(P)-dependent oxidoreductase, partial [Vicinamibacterales bacterium]
MELISSTLAAAKALADVDVRTWVLTRGAQSAGGMTPDLVQAPLWALAGVMAAEFVALKVVRIDLDSDARDVSKEAAVIVEHLLSPDREDRIAIRGEQRLVARLTPSTPEQGAPETPRELEITERGSLSNLRLVGVPRQVPGAGQLEVRVFATGLNFRDVLNALGMYPGDPGPLGNECAGVVTAVGEGVRGFKVGDEVITVVDRSFATWVVAQAALTVKKPAAIDFAAAATIPVTFLTALYALRELSHIKPGDRVLIHAVTGGVGMAALQLALRAGAIVYGTAGTPAKRALAKQLGAHYVGDSRSLSFVDEFTRAGMGDGLDIVLNSLSGDFIPASLGMLRAGGHFVEIGKIGIWDSTVAGAAFPGRHYHALYLGEIAASQPDHLRGLLEEILADIEHGDLRPLPARCWPLDEAESAFRFMGQGHHTGKIVITQAPPPVIRPDASYLVTGGLTGLGLACAAGLVDAGARHLTLLGRRAPSASAVSAIEALRQRGVSVTVVSADVASADALARALAHVLPASGRQASVAAPPLRGILHAAGVLDDGLLTELEPARFAGVMSPKVRGTWNLHELSARLTLDFFVTFSSGSAILGSPGQANYSAANAFMDALAHWRRRAGQHALSINWGSWSGVGMAASLDDSHRRRWAALGA